MFFGFVDNGGNTNGKKRAVEETSVALNGRGLQSKKEMKYSIESVERKVAARCTNESDAEMAALLMDVKASGKPPAPSSVVERSTLTEPTQAFAKGTVDHDLDKGEDTNNCDGSSPSIPYGSGFESGFMSFPEKIMMLLDKKLAPDSMWWIPDGDAFCILPVPFTEKVLDKHFQGTKFESFTRKLNRWGFKRVAGDSVPSNAVAFYHPLFHKDKPELLKEMSGGKATKSPVQSREKKSGKKIRELISSGEELLLPNVAVSDKFSATLPKRNTSGLASSNPQIPEESVGSMNREPSNISSSVNETRTPALAGEGAGNSSIRGLQQPSNPVNGGSPAIQSPQLRELLAQQMNNDSRSLQALTNEARIREQLLRSRNNMNQVSGAADLMSSIPNGNPTRMSESDQSVPPSDVMRLLAQQVENMHATNMSTESSRFLLQQLGASNSLGVSDLASRFAAQRASALSQFGSGLPDTSALLLEQQLSNYHGNTDPDMAIRLLMAQQQQRAAAQQHIDTLSPDLSAVLAARQQHQARLMMAERLRMAEAASQRDSSSELLHLLLAQQQQQAGNTNSSGQEAADLRTRLLMLQQRSAASSASNAATAAGDNSAALRMQLLQNELLGGGGNSNNHGLNEQMLQELYLMEQQRARLAAGGLGGLGR